MRESNEGPIQTALRVFADKIELWCHRCQSMRHCRTERLMGASRWVCRECGSTCDFEVDDD